VERNAVEIKGGKEVTVYETWPIICQTVH
jgi:hypothetical protein